MRLKDDANGHSGQASIQERQRALDCPAPDILVTVWLVRLNLAEHVVAKVQRLLEVLLR